MALGRHGAFITMKTDAVFIDHTTASADLARGTRGKCSSSSMHFVDAPVSGGEQGARNGQLTIMCGGTPSPTPRLSRSCPPMRDECRLMGEAARVS